MSTQSIPSKLGPVFARCRDEGRSALIGYLPVGFPTVEKSIESFETMVRAGCDIIEVGIPYSDPMMDGPTIQAAADEALANGFRVRDTLDVVRAVTEAGGQAVIMSYWNPVLQYGPEKFAADLAAAAALTVGAAQRLTHIAEVGERPVELDRLGAVHLPDLQGQVAVRCLLHRPDLDALPCELRADCGERERQPLHPRRPGARGGGGRDRRLCRIGRGLLSG